MNETGETYTRSGVRRAGDEYQDVVALDVLVSMMEHPNRYEWLRVEADGFGYLDDVVALRKDGTIEAKQVKFSAHPDDADDPYDWSDLTATRKGKDGTELPSLIGKWGPTLLKLLAKHGKVDAALVTNRRAAPDLASCIDEGTKHVRNECVPRVVMDELERQLGGTANVICFLSSFTFKMDVSGLATWETGVHERFRSLGGEHVGWLNLKEALGKWVCEKSLPAPDGHIRLTDVQRAALWRRLEALPQGFSIPTDYVLPSTPLHQGIPARLSEKTGTCLVISGTPGVGKSTYLSYLYEKLRARKRPVVRHHYFLSLSDPTVGRFEHARVLESLMADLRGEAAGALGAFAGHNSAPHEFPKWLDACSAYYSKQECPLVIVVDGLDHVWRGERGDIVELTRLFEHLLPCRPGICVVVGTQPLAAASLPKRLLDAAPREKWIELPALDRQAVLEWTRKNESHLEFRRNTQPDDREEEFREIASAFFDVSLGQPLLLRYALSALIDTGQPVNARSILARIPVAAGGLTDYYRSLWNGLDSDGQFILHMIASSGFEWPEGGIVACCVRHGIGLFEAERSWQQVRHMMCRIPLGWRPFHSSLGVFVTGTGEYGAVLQQVRPAVAAWLTEEAPDYWRWAYEWTARADMGDHEPLLSGTTREWIVESLAKGYPHGQVCALLGRAARQALETGDLRGFAHKALMFEYVNDTFHLTNWDAKDEWTHVQLACGFVERLPHVLFNRRTELNDRQLAKLAGALCSMSDEHGVTAIRDELIDRVTTRARTGRTNDWISEVTPIIWTESLIEDFDADRIADWVRKNREHVDSVRFSREHAETLRAHKRADLLRQLCDADLTDEEREQFLKQGFLLALEEGADWSDVARRHPQSAFAAIYARAVSVPGFAAGEFLLADPQSLSMHAHEFYTRKVVVAAWLDGCFYTMLALYLWDRGKAVDDWRAGVGDHSWPRAFVQRLAATARELATAIRSDRRLTLTDFYGQFGGLARPEFNNRDEDHDLWQVARRVLVELGLDSVLLAAGASAPSIGRDAVEHAFGSAHCYRADWMREYVERRRLWLTGDALEWIAGKYGDCAGVSIEEMVNEGVSEASVLASLMAMHGRGGQSLGFLRRSVNLTLKYGYHKDILLYDYVDAVRLFAGRRPEAGRQELAPVIPAILHLGDFTDGDETSHVPGRLFDLLVTLSPEWLPLIYRYLCREEEYHDAADAFRAVLKSLPFVSPVEIALGSTCLGDDGLESISAKADQGCAGALQALDSVRQLLGRNPFPAREKEDKVQASAPFPTERSAPPKASDYPPDRVLEYWKAVREHSYNRGAEELKAWADHWERRASLGSIRDALVSLYDVEEFAEVANIIHDTTVRLEGRSHAWPWLVKAHREVHGWSAHWTSKDTALAKWEIVRRHYPARWLDFIVETMAPGRWSSNGIGIHGRFVRLIEYLLLLGKETEALGVLQGVRETVEELVSPLGIGRPDWLAAGNSREDQLLGLLLARLTWPSGMVRERACNALAGLLTDQECAERVSAALVEWIQRQELESVACFGLLPFIRARQLNAGVSLPAVEFLRSICARPSLLYEILLDELFPNTGRALAAGIGHAGAAPHGFRACTKFSKHHDHALPAIYRIRAASMEKTFGVPFQRQWAYEVEHTGDGLRRSRIDVRFWGRSDGEHYVAFDCPLSEGLRSGYLRALAWLAAQGEDRRLWAMVEALRTLPIDLGLWRVAPQARPHWWPVLESPEKTAVDTVPTAVFGVLDELWTRQRDSDWVLGMACGRIAEGGVTYDLDVFGIFQKCLGPETPEAETVWQSEPWKNGQILLDPVSPRFSGTSSSPRARSVFVHLGDWVICPCVLATHPHMVPRWQWWRLLRGFWIPLTALARDGLCRVSCETDRIAFHDEDGELGYWRDWTAGVSELQDADLTPRTGQVLMLRRTAVEQFAAANGLTFCWVCRISGCQREHRFGEHNKFNIYRVIGGSNLVL